jgi:hypothetical protein
MLRSVGTWFRRQSVARKLTATAVTTSGIAVFAACSVFAIYDYVNSRARLVRDVTTLADIVGTNSTAAVTFKDTAAAADTLRATAVNEHILDARLFTREGALLATYTRANLRGPALPEHAAPGVEAIVLFHDGHLLVARPISLNGEIIGSIVVESDTSEVWTRLARFAAIAVSTLLGALWLAFACRKGPPGSFSLLLPG